MFARFDENPAMTLQDIKETKRYRRTHGRTDNVKTVYPPQTKFAGGIMKVCGGYNESNVAQTEVQTNNLSIRLIKSDEMGVFFAYTFSLILVYFTKYSYSS